MMQNKTLLHYSKKSSLRLTQGEESFLVTYLSSHWSDALKLPIIVTEGYGIYSTDFEKSSVLYVGRNEIYEQIAKARVHKVEKKNSKIRGLYYPTATPSKSLLYQAALYFDEIFIVHPGSTILSGFHRRHPYGDRNKDAVASYEKSYSQFVKRLEAFDKETLVLKQAGILNALPPQMQDHPNFIELITADLDDSEFRKIADQSWDAPVFIAATKMEPLLPLIGDGMDPDSLRREIKYRSTYPHFSDTTKGDIFDSRHYGVKEVHPVLASTILLNHAFLLSEKFNLIPFTDSLLSTNLLQCKLRRIANMAGFADYKKELNLSSATLAVRVLEEYLPKFEFESFDDVIEARSKLQEHLSYFRESMASFAGEIDESPYSAEFLEKIEKITATKIKPAVQKLENEIRTSRDTFISKFLRNAQTGSIPIVASIFAGLPAELVIALSAGVMTFEAAIETHMEIRSKKRNGLTLLLQ